MVLDRLKQSVGAVCPERYGEVVPHLAWLASLPLDEETETRLQDTEGGVVRERTFTALETLLGGAARKGPLVVVCEDLHWADPTSLALLERLLVLTGRVGLLLVCVFRPERGHGSWHIREVAARDCAGRHTDLWLEALTETQSRALVDNLLAESGSPGALLSRILKQAEGNPFYVEEVIRSLIDAGVLVYDEAAASWGMGREGADVVVPETLQGVLVARIDRLAEETKQVLRLASVVGRVFPYRVLARVAATETVACEAGGLENHLAALQAQELIRERAQSPELAYVFKHELTQEAAYNGLLKRERRAFHRQVAQALEELFPERVEEQGGLLAHHWERAGDAEQAIAHLLQAGDRARLLTAHAEAVDFYERALVLLKEQGELERAARTLMTLGLTHHSAYEFRAAQQAYDEGFAVWQRASEVEPAEPPPPAPHACREISDGPLTLDPGLAQDAPSIAVIANLFSGLATLTAEMTVVPDVARSWEVLEGGRRYVFHLRDDVRWTDGEPVTAHDFEYAWKRVLDPATESRLAEFLYDIRGARATHQGELADADRVGVRALDSTTLAVELEGPVGYFLQVVALPAALPVPRHVVGVVGRGWTEVPNVVTNGPFRLAAWERGERLVLERSLSYHGRFAGNLRRMEFLARKDPITELGLYEADRLEIARLSPVSAAERARAIRQHAGEYVSVAVLMTGLVAFGVTRPPFSDPRVRRALALAVDREMLSEAVGGGSFVPATGGLVPPGMPGHSAGIGLRFDPDQARRLLAEAGLPAGHGFPPLECLVYRAAGPFRRSAENLQAQWRENLGLQVAWTPMDTGEMLARRQRRAPHMWLAGWTADYPDPDNFLRVGEWRGTGGWEHAAYDGLVEGARRVLDQEQRVEMYREAELVLAQEAPIVPLWHMRREVLVKPWVRQYRISPLGMAHYQDLVLEPH
jgi:oligopeptide transport system substrate-binding protein